MRREWEPEELIAEWTRLDCDWELVGNKTEATRLGFGLMLKFFELEGRFPRHVGELPKAAVGVVTLMVGWPADGVLGRAGVWFRCSFRSRWSGRCSR